MPVRTASAVWVGNNTEGQGTMKMVGWEGPYGFKSRFEDGPGTNPEEVLAAAHAGCFTQALSGVLTRAGFPPTRLETSADVKIEKLEEGFRITQIVLNLRGEVPGITAEKFQESAESAKKNCPVSKALAGVNEILLNAMLV
ncbi:MAG: OsmC family protein [Chloroflexi bacterium]|nr:OsmC family protein [Chloroflexota bacterium]